jgi:hypothetical protein
MNTKLMKPPIIEDKNRHPMAIKSSHNWPHINENDDFLEAPSVENWQKKKKKKSALK